MSDNVDHPERKAAKSQLRHDLLQRRAAVTAAAVDAISKAICGHLATWLATTPATQVFLYASISGKGEADVLPLATLRPELRYALPVTTGRAMDFFAWHAGASLVPGRFGIFEPDRASSEASVKAEAGTVILVPCLALARDGIRLGYGGGYFDRYLATLPHNVTTVGIVHHEFLLASLPSEPHDIPMAFAATEAGVVATAQQGLQPSR